MTHLAVGMFGGQEIFIILAILLLLFGGRKLPELARAMGSSITQFKKGLREPEDPDPEQLKAADSDPAKPSESSRTP